ncbi:MAG: asparaginase [bacterium]
MKRILFITTGGTIASSRGEEGFSPTLAGADLLQAVPELDGLGQIQIQPVLNIDSSNMQPENWVTMAETVFAARDDYDGAVIAHGTDTMAYTSAALSFMLRNITIPVILTGSQIPMGEPGSDAPKNIYDAFCFACDQVAGVYIVFGGKVINGARATKIHTKDFQAFVSLNYLEVATIHSGQINYRSVPARGPVAPAQLSADLCPDVCLIKLVPGTKPELLAAVKTLGYRGVVIEGFGAGGVPFTGRNLVPKIEELLQAGIAVVITTQCPYGGADLTLYEVGQKALKTGAIPAYDMATEAVVTKLMWTLGQTADLAEVARIMLTDYVGEIRIPNKQDQG